VTRPRLVAGNWKMHLSAAEARRLAAEVVSAAVTRPWADVAVFPAYTALAAVRETLASSRVALGAQACHEADQGAHTGEVSAPMLADAGVTIVLCGHSERRAAGESDESVGKRVRAALRSRLRPLVCVGETLADREANRTDAVLARQFAAAFADVAAAELDAIDLAYEPVWAIGTGRTATPQTAASAHAVLRDLLVGKFGAAGRGPRILYGGSVKAGNAGELLAAPDVGGLLVGGASLDAVQFRPIVESVQQEPSS
jgi:triosephosphate isomerase